MGVPESNLESEKPSEVFWFQAFQDASGGSRVVSEWFQRGLRGFCRWFQRVSGRFQKILREVTLAVSWDISSLWESYESFKEAHEGIYRVSASEI